MNYKCIRNCSFKGRSWFENDVIDFGDVIPPHHFVATNEETNRNLPKSRVDVMSAVPSGTSARSFYEIGKNKTNINVGFASTLEKDEVMHTAKLKVKK